MLFSLTNLPKKSLRDEDGALAVVPRLLKGRAAVGLVRQAIEHMDASLGVRRGEFDGRALEAIMGNYRMGRCIEACLMTHYSFKQPAIESILAPEQLEALQERGLVDSSSLRLALWDHVNRAHGGFAPVGERYRLLVGFAEECGLPPDAALVDRLLTIDREEVATLERAGERPSPGEVVLQYNRGAVRTLLAHAARVVFRLRQVPGATLKRTYFVAKRRGVYVDIEHREAGGFTVLLHGPESATGGADRYGARLADVSLSLLRSLLGEVGEEAFDGATAYLVMHDREYRFHLTPELLARLEYEPKAESSASGNRVAERGVAYSVGGAVDGSAEAESDEPLFDSLVEAKLYREFKSLERQGYTNGWQMLREPDPLLAPGSVMIPDFAFRRGEACVYMEIVGFWSPGYREKKLQKLRLLSGSSPDTALILAVPRDNAEAYGGLPFPVAPYKTGVRSTDLLTLLNTRYGGRESREEGAQERLSELRSAALKQGFVREQEVADALQAYSRTELLSAVRDLSDDEVVYVAGIGLMTRKVLAHVEAALRDGLQVSDNKLPLEDAERIASEALGERADVESLLAALPDLQIERPSLFEAYLVGV